MRKDPCASTRNRALKLSFVLRRTLRWRWRRRLAARGGRGLQGRGLDGTARFGARRRARACFCTSRRLCVDVGAHVRIITSQTLPNVWANGLCFPFSEMARSPRRLGLPDFFLFSATRASCLQSASQLRWVHVMINGTEPASCPTPHPSLALHFLVPRRPTSSYELACGIGRQAYGLRLSPETPGEHSSPARD